MEKASRAKQNASLRDRIAAQRAAQRRREVRNRILIFSGIAVVVIAVVLGFVIAKLNSKSATTKTAIQRADRCCAGRGRGQDHERAHFRSGKGGGGSATSPPSSISGTPLTAGGSPRCCMWVRSTARIARSNGGG